MWGFRKVHGSVFRSRNEVRSRLRGELVVLLHLVATFKLVSSSLLSRLAKAIGATSGYVFLAFKSAHLGRRTLLIYFDKHVFVLGVANDKGAFSILFAFDELKAAQRRVSVDERNGTVVVLARCDAAFATVPDENRLLT